MDRDERQKIIQELAGKHFSLIDKPVPGRANTPGQRQQILTWIGILWEQNPKMRLGQLIVNATCGQREADFSNKLFYTEDYPLLDEMREYYEHTETF